MPGRDPLTGREVRFRVNYKTELTTLFGLSR
jgi:hypothetical protein